MARPRHADAGAAAQAYLDCPAGENPKYVLAPRAPWIGDRVRRHDGQARTYAATGGGEWVLGANEIAQVAELGGGSQAYAHGIRLQNAAGKITRDFMPVDSWQHEDGAQMRAPTTRGANCPKCGKLASSFPAHKVNCTGCAAEVVIPGDKPQPVKGLQPNGRWPQPLKVPAGVDIKSVKQLVETAKGIPRVRQTIAVQDRAGKKQELSDDMQVAAGQRLQLQVHRPPLQELNERLDRIDSQGMRLATAVERPPWEEDYVLHCLPTDKDPGLLGSGGFASVFRCRRKGAPADTPDLYAVKQMMKTRISDTYSQVRQSLVEICCSMTLPVHPHLIHIDEVRHDRDRLYYIMPLVRGTELYSIIQDKALQAKLTQQPVIARLMRQLFAALEHLHGRGIAHRDVKPENILCDPDNRFHVTLIDLGLARFCGDPVAATPGGLAGLPATAQLTGQKKADPLAEVDFGSLDDSKPITGNMQKQSLAYQAMLDVMPTPGAMTVAYAAVEAIQSALQQEERTRRQLPMMDVYGAGATCFACLVRQVPFLRMREMQKMQPREWMKNMAERAKLGIEAERGWDEVQRLLDPEGCNFIKKLMVGCDQRYTAEQALRDEWLCKYSKPEDVCQPLATPMPDAARFQRPCAAAPAAGKSPVHRPAQPPAPEASPTNVMRKRPAEDHMVGAEGLNALEQGQLLSIVPGGARQLSDDGSSTEGASAS
eukprot:TRINITY_DN135_c0_g2_i1.p1 TRINITY_DN135_c0_g2~~TRINITY_DN135_c0_g2_i1.p1  ORF type:complete len:746 (+),score=221.66 TRINITY_DN135_c0_g2_i1:111-2240(+)